MASEASRIQEQLRRAITGEAWHGPSVLDAVAWFDAERAARRVAASTHSPWEIVLHIGVWLDVVRDRLAGNAFEPTAEQDWPAVPRITKAAWDAARARLNSSYQALHDAIGKIPDEQLERVVPGRPYTNYVMLQGVIQHSLYHAGQLILIERATRDEP